MLIFFFQVFNSTSQNQKIIDSLEVCLASITSDTTKLHLLNDLSWELIGISNYKKAVGYLNTAKTIENDLTSKEKTITICRQIAFTQNNFGVIFDYQGEYQKAIESHLIALKIRTDCGFENGIAGSLCNIGSVYENQGIYPKAIDYYLKALKVLDNISGKKFFYANVLGSIGSLYLLQNDYTNALKYTLKSLEHFEEIHDKRSVVACKISIGKIYVRQGKYEQAVELLQTVLEIANELDYVEGTASTLESLGDIYEKQLNYKYALVQFLNALKIKDKIGNKQGVAITLNKIGGIYIKQDENNEALNYCLKGLQIAKEIGALNEMKESHKNLSEIYKHKKDFEKEILHYRNYVMLKDSIFNKDNIKKNTATAIELRI